MKKEIKKKEENRYDKKIIVGRADYIPFNKDTAQLSSEELNVFENIRISDEDFENYGQKREPCDLQEEIDQKCGLSFKDVSTYGKRGTSKALGVCRSGFKKHRKIGGN